MEIKGNFINFNNNDDDSRAKKIPQNSSVPKKEIQKTAENKAPVDPKYWQNNYKVSFGNKEKIEEDCTNYSDKLLELCKDYPPHKSLTFVINNESAKKLCEIIQSGKLTAKELSEISNKIGINPIQDKEEANSFVSTLCDTLSKNEDSATNQGIISCIKKLSTPFLFMNRIRVSDFADEIKNYSEFRKQVIEYFAQFAKKEENFVFGKPMDFKNTVSMLDENNFEAFKADYEKEYQSNNPCAAIYNMFLHINPKTQKYDSSLFRATEEFCAKKEKFSAEIGIGSFFSKIEAAEIVREMVDKQTGEISDAAVKFTNDYYFREKEEPKQNILSSIIKRLHSSGRYGGMTPYYKSSFSLQSDFKDILHELKDNTGAFNETNIRYMSRLMESKHGWYSMYDKITFFPFLKDENGVVEKSKFAFAEKILEETNDMTKTGELVEIYSKRGKAVYEKMMKFTKKLYKDQDRIAYNNFPAIARNCFQEDGTPIYENIELVNEINEHSAGYINFDDNIFQTFKDPYCKKLLAIVKNKPTYSFNDIMGIVSIKKIYSDENGEIPVFVKDKIDELLKTEISLHRFCDLYENCTSETKDGNKHFNENLWQSCLELIKYSPDGNKALGRKLFSKLEISNFIALVNGSLNINSLKFKSKVELYEELKKVKFENLDENCPLGSYLKNLFYEIDTNLSGETNSLPVEQKYINNFVSSVYAKGIDGKLSDFEATLKNAILELKEMKEGLPLNYSRQNFLADLSKLADSEEKIKRIEGKTDINLYYEFNDKQINITGYEGILTLDKLDRNDEFENEVYELCHRFMYDNEVTTGNSKLDKELNTIIKASPEFINCIGKKQHGTHDYTLDIHQLLVLANSFDNPDYQKLNDTDKIMLKITAIFHDIAKQERVIDKGHQEPSALYSRGIIKKFIKNPEAIERIYELTRNHHWLEEYSTKGADEKAAQVTAFKFRRPNDFEIAKIMAKSDLMSVSDTFYEKLKSALSENKMQPIEDSLKKLYSTGNAVFSDYFIRPQMLDEHKETFNGQEYKVVNLHNLQNDDSLVEFGFRNVKKKDAKFLVHMLPERDVEKYIGTIKQLTNSIHGGVLSESLITPLYKRTYCNRKFGVLLSQINPNVINMAKRNQGSGTEKDVSNAVDMIFDDNSEQRKTFKETLLKNLSINPENVSEDDFCEFYRDNIALKTSLSNFVDSKEYSIGDIKVTGKQLKDAIEQYQSDLIDKKEMYHNEIVGYAPKIQGVIAKAKSLSEIPNELLDFANKNNYPIILI